MSPFLRARLCLWICRLVPLAFWTIAILWVVLPDPETLLGDLLARFAPRRSIISELLTLEVVLFCWGLGMLYFIVITVLMPELFEDSYLSQGFRWRLGYLIFALLTVGVGPCIWYWLKADRPLRQITAGKSDDEDQI